MQDSQSATSPNQLSHHISDYLRTTARIIGVLYLAGMAVGIPETS